MWKMHSLLWSASYKYFKFLSVVYLFRHRGIYLVESETSVLKIFRNYPVVFQNTACLNFRKKLFKVFHQENGLLWGLCQEDYSGQFLIFEQVNKSIFPPFLHSSLHHITLFFLSFFPPSFHFIFKTRCHSVVQPRLAHTTFFFPHPLENCDYRHGFPIFVAILLPQTSEW